jgi:hypothetical protein
MIRSVDHFCFRCEREDAGNRIPYEQCLSPLESFNPSLDCVFLDKGTKSISCQGTNSDQPFQMDVSLAKEKLAVTLPAFMDALDRSVRERYPNQAEPSQLTGELRDFLQRRISWIIRHENLAEVTEELSSIINRHLKAPLPPKFEIFFKASASEAMSTVSKDLAGRKDYSLSRFILLGVAIAKSIPSDSLGQAHPFLSGAGLAYLLTTPQTSHLAEVFEPLNPSLLGAKSAESLVRDLQNIDAAR